MDSNYKGADLEKRTPEIFPFLEMPLYDANIIVTKEILPPKGVYLSCQIVAQLHQLLLDMKKITAKALHYGWPHIFNTKGLPLYETVAFDKMQKLAQESQHLLLKLQTHIWNSHDISMTMFTELRNKQDHLQREISVMQQHEREQNWEDKVRSKRKHFTMEQDWEQDVRKVLEFPLAGTQRDGR